MQRLHAWLTEHAASLDARLVLAVRPDGAYAVDCSSTAAEEIPPGTTRTLALLSLIRSVQPC